MLNALFPEIPWKKIKYVGFDLDGTLYDEFDFISQVYPAIIDGSGLLQTDNFHPLRYMLDLWLKKGSSYNRIFSETFTRFAEEHSKRDKFIADALYIFRNFKPDLKLNDRNRYLLEHFKSNYTLFLISDGSGNLQRNKFTALNLEDYFALDKVIFTGEWGASAYKPSPRVFNKLPIDAQPHEIVYFGDRTIDKDFCNNLRIHFQLVYNMVSL